MVKLIHSGAMPEALYSHFTVMEDPAAFTKAASGGWDYDALKPDDKHVGIHLIALGETERYGYNRNGDGFPKTACVKYHPTFVKHGHLYEHHRNKDPQKSLGTIVKSAYNPDMGRIELFIHAHKEKAAGHLEKMAKDGEVPFSMACRVKNDRCSVCNTLRKTASDPDQCDHVRTKLGQILDDGQFVGTQNDEPKFFDISFVYRPADRIAWSLKAASADEHFDDSITMAKAAGVWVPEDLVYESRVSREKRALARDLADYERRFYNLAQCGPRTEYEHELWNIRKAASTLSFNDEQIAALRTHDPDDVLHELARNQIVMDPVSYCKYAMGDQLDKLGCSVEAVAGATNGIFNRLVDNSEKLASVCNDGFYDVQVDGTRGGLNTPHALRSVTLQACPQASFATKHASYRAIVNTMEQCDAHVVEPRVMSKVADSGFANVVAEKYATYKLAATHAMIQLCGTLDQERQLALLAAQNVLAHEAANHWR
jgi:hypothetical protein